MRGGKDAHPGFTTAGTYPRGKGPAVFLLLILYVGRGVMKARTLETGYRFE